MENNSNKSKKHLHITYICFIIKINLKTGEKTNNVENKRSFISSTIPNPPLAKPKF